MNQTQQTTTTEPSPPVVPRCRSAEDQDLLVARTSALLRDHVPLCLLLDIAGSGAPDSVGCFTREVADLDWLLPMRSGLPSAQ